MRELPGFGAPGGIRVTVGTDEENDAFAAALGARDGADPEAGRPRPYPLGDRARLAHARPARARPPALRAALDAPRARGAGVLLRRPAAATAATPPGRARSSCSSACATSTARSRERGGGLVIRHGPRRARAARAGRARSGADEVHFSADVGPFARRAHRARCAGRCASAASSCGAPGRGRGRRPRRAAHPGRQALHGVLALPPHAGSRRRAARCSARRARCRALPSGAGARAGCPSLDVARPRAGGARSRRAAARAAARERLAALPARRRARLRGQPRRARRATAPRGSRPTCTSAASRAREIEERLPRRRGRGGVPAPALLARLLPPRAAPLPAQRPLGVPGALPRQIALEPRRASASRRGARAAPASRSWTPGCASCGARAGCTTARGSWSARSSPRTSGIDWRWGERWFMRLLVDGDEANNNGNWQWIASVGTDPSRRSGASTTRRATWSATTPTGRYVRRYVPELRDVPDEHLAEPWTMPEEVQREAGCVIGRGLPGADRGPRRGAARGARALPRC